MTLVMIPKEELLQLITSQQEILHQLKELKTTRSPATVVNYVTAMEFMEMVHIRRTRFDQLVQKNKIKIIRVGRKIYVPKTEIERYFMT